MKKTKFLTLLPFAAMMMTSCAASRNYIIEYDPEKVYNIGICQFVAHQALDSATNGFI